MNTNVAFPLMPKPLLQEYRTMAGPNQSSAARYPYGAYVHWP